MNMFPDRDSYCRLSSQYLWVFQTFWALLRWQYTDSFRDEHTRSVLLRGSSRYQPRVSEKFPSNPQSLNWLPGEVRGEVGWKLVESSEGREFRILRHRTASDGLGFPGSAECLENKLDRLADCDAIVWQIQIDIGYWSSPHFLLFDMFA